jgi:hypothetical protein
MKWMKVDEARAYCGGLSRGLLYRAVRSGQLRASRVGAGRSLMFADEWCDAYLRANAPDAGAPQTSPVSERRRLVS